MRLDPPLTYGESLRVRRRRLQETQAQAAKRHRVSRFTYCGWEAAPRRPDNAVALGDLDRLGPLTDSEVCEILRRRAGLTVNDLAEVSGISRTWIIQMERGLAAPRRLVEFWARPNVARLLEQAAETVSTK